MRWFLLFTVVPLVELWLLLRIGARIGPGPTLAWVVATGLLGAVLIRSEGIGVLRRILEEVRAGGSTALPLVEGALVLLGGALLVTPGLLTDLTGILLLLPPTRRLLAPHALAWVARRVVVLGGPERREPPPSPFASPFDDPR